VGAAQIYKGLQAQKKTFVAQQQGKVGPGGIVPALLPHRTFFGTSSQLSP
jgi:hypothetical protein